MFDSVLSRNMRSSDYLESSVKWAVWHRTPVSLALVMKDEVETASDSCLCLSCLVRASSIWSMRTINKHIVTYWKDDKKSEASSALTSLIVSPFLLMIEIVFIMIDEVDRAKTLTRFTAR